MNKQLLYSLSIISLLAVAIVGGTYAFYAVSTTSNNIVLDSSKFVVIYTGDTDLEGELTPTSSKAGGVSRTVHIGVSEDSSEAKANIYINIEELTENLSIAGFKWEVYGMQNGVQVYSNSNNFQGYNDTTNNVIPIVENYKLTAETTDFTVYIWIDGSITDNEILGGQFRGYIGAETERFTGEL